MCKLSVRLVMVTICVILIVSTAVAALLITYNFSVGAAHAISDLYASSITSKAKSDIESFLNRPVEYITGLQYTLRQNEHPLPSAIEPTKPDWYKPWWSSFVSAMRASGFEYQFSVIGFNDGNYVGCKNLPQNIFQCRLMSWKTRATTGKSFLLEENYNRTSYERISTSNGSTTYDPRTRVWYRMVNHTQDAKRWSDVYLSAIPTLPIVDMNAAFFNSSGTFLGVGSFTFELGALTSLLTSLSGTSGSASMLLDSYDLLLGTTLPMPFLTQANIPSNYSATMSSNCLKSDSANGATSSILLCRQSIDSYGYEPLREMKRIYPSMLQSGFSGSVLLKLGAEKYFVSVVTITTKDAEGLGWRFALFVPENDIVGEIIRGRNFAIIIVSCLLFAACVLCFVTATLLLRPLDAVVERMHKTATQLEDNNDDMHSISYLREVAAIQDAFNNLSAELAKVKSYLPANILNNIDIDDDEDNDGALAGSNVDSVTQKTISLDDQQHNNSVDVKCSTNPPSTVDNASSYYRHSVGGGGSSLSKKGAAPVVQLNTAVKLTARKVTILTVNLLGFHTLIKEATPDSLLGAYGEVVELVGKCTTENKGVLDGFHGDRFSISFNASRAVGNHAVAAAGCALSLLSLFQTLKSKNILFATLDLTCGIASGHAQVGNAGSTTNKRFCVFGPVVHHSALLERLCKSTVPISSILVTGIAVADMENFYELLCVDVIPFPYTCNQATSPMRVFSIKEQKNAASDEWMYQLQEGGKTSKFGKINTLFEGFLASDPAVLAELKLKSRNVTEDLQSQSVIKKLQLLVDDGEVGSRYVNNMQDYYGTCEMPLPGRFFLPRPAG